MIRNIGILLTTMLSIYGFILFLRIIVSWLSLPPSKFTFYLNKITDPVLDYARKIMPFKIGVFDISIILPFLAIMLLNQIIVELMIAGNPITPLFLVKLLLLCIQMVEGFVFWIFIIISGIILIFEIFKVYAYNPIVSSMNELIDPVILFLSRVFTIRSKDAKAIYLAIFIVAMIIVHAIFNSIMNRLIYLCSVSIAANIL
jgi:uncharacterized protein YggT (Ycf19 family)